MSGGGSGNSGSAPSSTTANNTDTVINDVPAWEQQYLTSLLGQAQTVAAQPYQQFPGQEVAGLTPDQTQAFSNVENLVNNGPSASLDASANTAAQAGANTANGISAAGSPYYQASTAYNPLAAASPFIGAAANAGSPQGISSYLSPYTNNVVQGLVNTANQNWNNNIMPGVNDSFIGSGQYGSGRNAAVLGQQGNIFEQNLEGSVANALQSGYTTAGNQADAQAANLSGLANTAANATTAQAANLQNAGAGLGNLAATQAGAQGNAATNLANTASTGLNTGITGAAALQSVGQQQQTQDQTNINQAMNDFTNQTMWPETQTSFLSNIIRGLPSGGSSSTGASQSPATTGQIGSVSPLSTLAGSLLGASGVAGATGHKKGGLMKGYAQGGPIQFPENSFSISPQIADYSHDFIQALDDYYNTGQAPSVQQSFDTLQKQGILSFSNGGKVGYADGGSVSLPENFDTSLLSNLLSGNSNYDIDGIAGAKAVPPMDRSAPTASSQPPSDNGITLDGPSPSEYIPSMNASDIQPPSDVRMDAPISAALSAPDTSAKKVETASPYSDTENPTTSVSPLQTLSSNNTPPPESDSQVRNYQLLAAAKGFLTPAHSGAEALGNAFGGFENVGLKGPEYENQQQEVIAKKFGNASTYAGLLRQNAINQSLGLPPIPIPNISGMGSYGQQVQQSMQPSQSATTTASGQIRPVGDAQGTSAVPVANGGMNIMQALQISNGRVPATEEQKYQAVTTLQAAQFPVPATMAEEAKQYAQDKGKLGNADVLAAAAAKGKAIYTPTETRGEGGVTLFRDPLTGQQNMLTGRFKGESLQGAGTLTPASIQPVQPGAGLPGQLSRQSVPQSLQVSGAAPGPSGQGSPQINVGNAPTPDSNSTEIKWPVPVQNPSTPFGVQPGENMTSLPQYVNQWRDKNYPMMANLQTQMQQQSAIDDALGNLKNASMLQPGTWADERLAIVNAANTAQRAMGNSSPQSLMSQASAANAAEFIKSAQQNTNAAAHEISSRGTNFDIVSAAKANPQYSMPYMAGLITNSMNSEAVTRNYNRIKYIDDRLNHGISEAQATQEFENQQPGDLVVKRAESAVNPIPVTKSSINRYLPGTQVTNGKNKGYIPIPKDYPFMVPYTNPLVKAQQTGSQ